MDELCSKEKDISEYTITELKFAEYQESSVTKEVPSYFNMFECGKNILDRLDVTYKRACMATPKDKYYEKMLENLFNDNNHIYAPFSNEKIRQAVSKVMEETEAEFGCLNKITMDTSFKSSIQKKDISKINDSGYN